MKWNPQALITKKNESSSRKKWHGQIKSFHELSEYLTEGQPQPNPSWVEALKRSTAEVVSTTLIRVQCDEFLRDLISEHVERSPFTRGVAVLSCLPAFSPLAAVEHLLALKDLNEERYLRCVNVAYQLKIALVTEDEIRIVRALLTILYDQQRDLDSFRQLIKALFARTDINLITDDIVQSILAKSGIRTRIENIVLDLLQSRYFATLHNASSWLRIFDTAKIRTELEQLLNEFFPSWALLWIWRPNMKRIRQWEHADLKDAQRRKLLRIYDLDGPDTIGQRHECLRLFEPACYERLDLHPRDAATLERLLDNLYLAHCVGDAAVDLFIHICVDSRPDGNMIALLEACVATTDNSSCQALLAFLKASRNSSSLYCRIKSMVNALQSLNSTIFERSQVFSVRDITANATDILRQAQARFCMQLANGLTGEFIGMHIYELGSAIYQATWMHTHLPSRILNQLSQLPSRDVLKTIFHLTQDTSGPENFLFKSYLESSIGGREAANSSRVTLDAIQQQVQFWMSSPDSIRKDLARALGGIRSLEYAWYTKCLTVMFGEVDLYVEEMRQKIQLGSAQTVQTFAEYLRDRRGLRQLQNECWLLLFVALIREQGDEYLERIAGTMSFGQWHAHILDLKRLIEPARLQLPGFGPGLTRGRLEWWDNLAQKRTAIEFLLERQLGQQNFLWLYFPRRQSSVEQLLEILSDETRMTPLNRQIVSRLDHDGVNVDTVIACFFGIERATDFGRHNCELILARRKEGWPEEGLNVLIDAWRNLPGTLAQDLAAFNHVQELFFWNVSELPTPAAIKSTADHLLAAHDTLIGRARRLEMLRTRLRSQEPERTATLLNRIGVDNPGAGRAFSEDMSDELIDVVETVGDSEYEISFPLTGLGDLQRRARGIPTSARMLLIRLCVQDRRGVGLLVPSFCIHLLPQDDNHTQHHYWMDAFTEPVGKICNRTLNLFTFHIVRNLHRLLQGMSSGGQPLLQSVHFAIQNLITKPPQTCILCSNSLAVKLWKPAACSRDCSLGLRNAPLEVRLHNLLVDPLAIDLLLTSIYAAATDAAPLELLPGCPVPRSRLKAVIDSLPQLTTLQTASNLYTAIRGSGSDGYSVDRERLLSWLCLKFRGFMVTAPDGFRVPSMPHTKQFVLVNSHHEREAQYQAQTGAQLNNNVVFHGTRASRLFVILANGLQVMTGAAVLHGAVYGPGIYSGDDQITSFGFAGSTGQSWRHSELGNMKVMLGCELAAYAPSPHGTAHVVTDEKRVLVRYVFLLPGNFRCPPRHHVESAMQVAYAMLRSGVNN